MTKPKIKPNLLVFMTHLIAPNHNILQNQTWYHTLNYYIMCLYLTMSLDRIDLVLFR